jgi:hypothetical protein
MWKTTVKPLLILLLVQLIGPGLKVAGLAFTKATWWEATSLLWGPWLLLAVAATGAWLASLFHKPPKGHAEAINRPSTH